MNLERRIETFTTLGHQLRTALDNPLDAFGSKLNKIIERQKNINPWFTPGNVRLAIRSIADELTEDNLRKWTAEYPVLKDSFKPVRVGLIFAGNIPLAGFHDLLSVLISGNSLIAKTSSKDPDLIPFLGEMLISINPAYEEYIKFTNGTLTGFDSVIATGSNNSSRYFDYYFKKYPNIIRKNRNSIAIINGDESTEELNSLGTDIFSYFGMGCRNVSKIYLPADYDVTTLPAYWAEYSDSINHSGYGNNYDYNKAIYLVNKQKFFDAGFILLREDSSLVSPVSVLYYEYYQSTKDLSNRIRSQNEALQCIVGRDHIPFGKSQMPHLWDYADGIDTLEFLLKKNMAGIL